jgi:small subunit ribosomal protein S17
MKSRKRTLRGVVTSDKMDKTIVVQVERIKTDEILKKRFKTYKSFKAHDESNAAKEGDIVSIVESRPFSKTTRFKLRNIIEKRGS